MAHLIDKSALVAEIERLKTIYKDDENIRHVAKYNILVDILSFLDNLEVKDMDLDNEYIEELYSHLADIKETVDRMTSGNFMHNKAAIKFSANTIAKVLELIGLKMQK